MQIFVGHLGAEENLRPRHAGGAQAFTDRVLGAVFARGVDVTVAALQRGGDVLGADVAHARGAEADGGNGSAVGRQRRGEGHGAFRLVPIGTRRCCAIKQLPTKGTPAAGLCPAARLKPPGL